MQIGQDRRSTLYSYITWHPPDDHSCSYTSMAVLLPAAWQARLVENHVPTHARQSRPLGTCFTSHNLLCPGHTRDPRQHSLDTAATAPVAAASSGQIQFLFCMHAINQTAIYPAPQCHMAAIWRSSADHRTVWVYSLPCTAAMYYGSMQTWAAM
jgi:hypothetical protein